MRRSIKERKEMFQLYEYAYNRIESIKRFYTMLDEDYVASIPALENIKCIIEGTVNGE